MIEARKSTSGTPEVLDYFQGNECGHARLIPNSGGLACDSASRRIPLAGDRFLDFLSSEQRAKLQKEMDFWKAHFGGEVDEDESEASFQKWASWRATRSDQAIFEISCGSVALRKRLPAKINSVEWLLTCTSGFLGIIGAAETLPLRNESFDVEYFKHSLPHVEDKKRAFLEAVRVTRKGFIYPNYFIEFTK